MPKGTNTRKSCKRKRPSEPQVVTAKTGPHVRDPRQVGRAYREETLLLASGIGNLKLPLFLSFTPKFSGISYKELP